MTTAPRIALLLFGVCYFALLLGSIEALKESSLVSGVLVGLRATVIVGLLTLWVAVTALSSRVHVGVALTLVVLGVYAFSGARAQVVDLVVLLATADLVRRHRGLDRWAGAIAAHSLFFVTTVALLAIVSLIPSSVHEIGSTNKASLGFWNPNAYYSFAFASALVFFLLRRSKLFWLALLFIATFFTLGGSRTYGIASALLALVWLVLRYDGTRRAVCFGSLVTYALVATLGLMSTIFVSEIAVAFEAISGSDLNQVISRRVEILERVSGQQSALSAWIGGDTVHADSSYQFMSSGFGIPLLAAALALVGGVMLRYMKTNQARHMAAIAILALIGLFEVIIDGSSMLSLTLLLLIVRGSPRERNNIRVAGANTASL